MNASKMWSEFVKPNYNENTHVQKNLILTMKMRSKNLTSFIFVFSILQGINTENFRIFGIEWAELFVSKRSRKNRRVTL